jgi:hypothetical protein
VGVALGWTYRIYRNERLGVYPSKFREFLEVLKLAGMVTLGQYLNFSNL